MVIFESIKWKNFLSTGNSFTEVNLLKNKTTLIVGANGAGKSTILDALSFGLFGKPFRNINKPQLLNTINAKKLEVIVNFSIGNRKYKIKRGIKPVIFEIYQDGKLINQSSEAKEYQEILEKNILKFNHKSFCQIVVLGNASFTPFMQLTTGNRREIIEDLLDIQIFSSMNSLLKNKISTNKSDLVENEFNIKLIAEKIEMQKNYLHTLKLNSNELLSQKQNKINDLNKNIIHLDKENIDIINKKNVLIESIKDNEKNENKFDNIRDIERQLITKKQKIEKELIFFTDNDDCIICKQNINHEHKNKIIEKNNDQLKEIIDALEKIDKEKITLQERLKEIKNIKQKIKLLETSLSNNSIQIQTLKEFIIDIEKEINQLNNERKITEEDSLTLQQLKNDLKLALDKKNELVDEKSVIDVAQILLKDSGIKTKIIKQYIPIINKLINKYLSAMDFFVNFQLDENFDEKIKSRYRDEFSYESFSEGEKVRIDFALLFTWRAIAKMRNSASTNLLIMDEVFDSSLDQIGINEFLKLIISLDNNTNVFIISHKGDQLFDKFENVIKFEKSKNFSRIVK